MLSNVAEYCRAVFEGDPHALRAFHKWATLAWFAAALPICLFLANSVPFLVFISVYAAVTGHWSSWQAARVETKQKEDADVAEVLERVEHILERME